MARYKILKKGQEDINMRPHPADWKLKGDDQAPDNCVTAYKTLYSY